MQELRGLAVPLVESETPRTSLSEGDATWLSSKAPVLACVDQAVLWVDLLNGSDGATGNSQASAIKSCTEMYKRLNAYIVAQPALDVRFVNYPVGTSDLFRVDLDLRQLQNARGPVVNFYAPPFLVDSQGTFSDVTPRNGNSPWVVTDGIVSTTSDVFKRIVVSGGPRAGATTWVSKSTGAGGRRTGEWGTFDPLVGGTYLAPQTGDPYMVLRASGSIEYDRVRILNGQAHNYPNAAFVCFHDFDFINNAGGGTAYAENGNAALVFNNCRFDNFDNVQIATPYAAIGSNTYIQNCCTTNLTGEIRFQQGGPNQNFIDAGIYCNAILADVGAGVTLDFDVLVDGSSSLAGAGVIAAFDNGVVVVCAAGVVDGQETGLFVSQDGGRLIFSPASSFYGNLGRGWGSTAHAGTFGVDCRDGGKMRVRTAAQLTTTGSGGDLRVGTTTNSWAAFAGAGFLASAQFDASASVSTGRSRPA